MSTEEAGARHRFPRDEIANALTHGLGFLLAVGGVPVLITAAVLYGTATEISTFSVYSATLILMYLASTLYHAAPHGSVKRFLHVLDRMAIYLLIAGTYTPFLLVGLGGVWGWSLFFVLWGLAAAGLAIRALAPLRGRLFSTLAYVLMGWAGIVAIVPLARSLDGPAFVLALAGGLSYTLGAAFYLWRAFPHHHAVWHLFCLGGSVCHFVAVFYLLP